MNYTKKLSNYCFERIESLNKIKVVLKWSFGEDTVGMCTCTMDQFFRHTRDNTDELRCFYLLGSLIDQTIFTHFQELYKEFRISLKFPKIFQHGLSTVMASPSIFFEVRELYKSAIVFSFTIVSGFRRRRNSPVEFLAAILTAFEKP